MTQTVTDHQTFVGDEQFNGILMKTPRLIFLLAVQLIYAVAVTTGMMRCASQH